MVELYWHQSQQGDLTTDRSLCPPGTWSGNNCYQSYGILQDKYIYSKGEWPMSRDDTANVAGTTNVHAPRCSLSSCWWFVACSEVAEGGRERNIREIREIREQERTR